MNKPPPSSIAIEESILGAFFTSNKMWLKYSHMIRPEYFYNENYKAIFEFMQDNNCSDIKIIKQKMASRREMIVKIISEYTYSGNFEQEISIVRDKYDRRRLIEIATSAIDSANNDDDTSAASLLDNTVSSINEQHISDGKPEHIRDLTMGVIDRLRNATSSTTMGYDTGLTAIDAILGGFVKKEMTILAARPSMGKTSFVNHLVRHLAVKKDTPVLFFSLEMGKESIAARILFSESNASYGAALLGAKSDLIKLSENMDRVNRAGIYIDDTPGMTVNNIQTKAENYVKNFGVKIIFIDHRGYIKPAHRGRSTNDEVSEISKSLCGMAKKLDVPVVLVCQLSREVERRSPPIPQLSDLRDSGTLEEDARKVIMLYREDYYKRDSTTPGVTSVIIAKNHNGETGFRNVFFEKTTMNFHNLDTRAEQDSYQDKW